MTLGEDSGLEVDALKGELGLHTRRWGAGHDAPDEEWLSYFLKRMESVPDENRTARFICLAVLMMPDGTEYVFEGEVKGTIMREQQAPILPGLPLSSVFLSDGADCVYAALAKEKKAQVSHRGHAVGQVNDFLLSNFL
jgi:XTP/dITP diphosphohydrolase